MKVITLPNEKLRMESIAVNLPLSAEDKKIADELIDYLALSNQEDNDLRPGVGIAAVQLGYLKRMFYVNFTDEYDVTWKELLINPEIIAESQIPAALESGEGCLSVLGKFEKEGLVHRKAKIIIKGYSYFKNKEVELTLSGYSAIVFQHEMDHLNGTLFIDRINKKRPWTKKMDEVIL